MSDALTQEQFLEDVQHHEMTVLMDNGVYRHLRFAVPGSGFEHFEIVTYPGHLVYSGDMGCYVFSRVPDMFQFFRCKRVNPWYWAEKVQAMDGNRSSGGSVLRYDEKAVRAMVEERRKEWLNELAQEDQQSRDGLNEAVDELLDALQGCAVRDFDALNDFGHDIPGMGRYAFYDLEFDNFRAFTRTYLWCCHALVWAIEQYDRAKAAQKPITGNQVSTQ